MSVAALDFSRLMKDGQAFQTFFIRLPPGAGYADLMRPEFFKEIAGAVGINDILRVQGADRAFDVLMTVTGKSQNGLRLVPFPITPQEERP
jgi:hypothetical protein